MTSRRPPLLPVAEARSRLLAGLGPLGIETVEIAAAAGRVLAEDAAARVTQPPFAASAMDGYAIRHADLEAGPTRLAIIGEAPAGAPFGGRVAAGEAVRLFTGAALPQGADTVVIQEDTTRDGDVITVNEAAAAGENVRAAGVDFAAGDTLLPAGTRIDGLSLALLAAGNLARVAVHRRPRLAIIATGDELRPPGSNLEPGQIVNSIAPGLAALVEDWGAEVLSLAHAGDSEAAIDGAIARALAADVLVLIGGASVGDYDLVKPTLASRGLALDFEKAAIKPGKPVWSGRIGATCILGLPGNPVSAFVCAHLFLKPAIHALTGQDSRAATALVAARLDGRLGANGGREAFLNATWRLEGGELVVTPAPRQDSSLLTPLAGAHCLLNRPAGAAPAETGALVDVLPLQRHYPGTDRLQT